MSEEVMASVLCEVHPRNSQVLRTSTLALPKSLHKDFVGDRYSVYWDNGLSKVWPCNEQTNFVGSQRVLELSRHKDLHSRYKQNQDRPTALTVVSDGAKQAAATARLEALAEHKRYHRAYELPKEPQSVVSNGAKHASPSTHTEHLAQPKFVHPAAIKDGMDWEWSAWQSNVTAGAKRAEASERIEALAQPKEPPKAYQPAASPFWPCGASTLNYTATERLSELAEARQHKSIHEDDPNKWKVSRAALRYNASERMGELAQPWPRKQRVKK